MPVEFIQTQFIGRIPA